MATSLRKIVSAEIGSFLLNNGFALADNSKNRIFQEELVSIANSLSDYYEEGTHLYPEVFLENVLPYDEQLLEALASTGKQREYFVVLIKENDLMKTELSDKDANGLFQNILNGYTSKIRNYLKHM